MFGDQVSVFGPGQHVRDCTLVDDQHAIANVLGHEAQSRATVLVPATKETAERECTGHVIGVHENTSIIPFDKA